MPAGEGSLAEALQAAAAGTDPAAPSAAAAGVDICTGPLQIKALKANVAGPLLLAVMPAATLTCLELGHAMDYVTEGTAETGLCGALAKLTGEGSAPGCLVAAVGPAGGPCIVTPSPSAHARRSTVALG